MAPRTKDQGPRTAFLGLGIMGSRMAANLRRAGFDVVVWNRTRARAEELGEPIADTPRSAASGADAVITMVVDAPQVEDVLFGADGAAEGLALNQADKKSNTSWMPMPPAWLKSARQQGAALEPPGGAQVLEGAIDPVHRSPAACRTMSRSLSPRPERFTSTI